jgi:hypothetical protein
MRPLMFANWRTINAWFCALMWIIVVVLLVIVFGHLIHVAPTTHPAAAPRIH